MKLTKAQCVALKHLGARPAGETATSYTMYLRLGTLCALERQGLAVGKREHGAFLSPRTAIRWQITAAGRAALATRGEG